MNMAFSCLITKSKKVYWKTGIDCHDRLQNMFVSNDKELVDNKSSQHNAFARIKIVPKNGDYINPDKWVYRPDAKAKPKWLDDSLEKPCWEAFEKWKKQVYSMIDLEAVRNPVKPLMIDPPKEITPRHKRLLKEWDSVRSSLFVDNRSIVWDVIRDSVVPHVGICIKEDVWDSVFSSLSSGCGYDGLHIIDVIVGAIWGESGNRILEKAGVNADSSFASFFRSSVWDSVGDCAMAYTSSMFPKIKEWKGIDKRNFNIIKGNPFSSAITLWKLGLIPSYSPFEGVWRLHGGWTGTIMFEIKKSELEKI